MVNLNTTKEDAKIIIKANAKKIRNANHWSVFNLRINEGDNFIIIQINENILVIKLFWKNRLEKTYK